MVDWIVVKLKPLCPQGFAAEGRAQPLREDYELISQTLVLTLTGR